MKIDDYPQWVLQRIDNGWLVEYDDLRHDPNRSMRVVYYTYDLESALQFITENVLGRLGSNV